MPVDASLAPNSREFLNKIAASLPKGARPSVGPRTTSDTESVTSLPKSENSDTLVEASPPSVAETVDKLADDTAERLDISPTDNTADEIAEKTPLESFAEPTTKVSSVAQAQSPASALTTPPTEKDDGTYEIIEVPLVFDAEFFDMLQSDVENLDALQTEEEKNMTSEIVALGKEVEQVAKPRRFSKTDLARWRQIFELYLDAEIFFATHEQDHGSRTSQVALKQLQWFKNQVEKEGIAKGFKLAESQAAYTRFVNLNTSLLKNMQFQELNKTAVAKILKSKLSPLPLPS